MNDQPPDLAALIVELPALERLQITDHLGRAVYQLELKVLSRTNPRLTAELHNWVDAKPFTASGLMPGDTVLSQRRNPRRAARPTHLNSAFADKILFVPNRRHLRVILRAVVRTFMMTTPDDRIRGWGNAVQRVHSNRSTQG